MVLEMKKEWSVLGVAADPKKGREEAEANGCPQWMKHKMEWPVHCSQDVNYPTMAGNLMRGVVKVDGIPGCGQTIECFEMQKDQNIFGGSAEGQLGAIREIAAFGKIKTKGEAKQHWIEVKKVKENLGKFGPHYDYFWEHRLP